MHHRSGSWVKGHYRNGTWIAGHNRKSTYVSDYTKNSYSKHTFGRSNKTPKLQQLSKENKIERDKNIYITTVLERENNRIKPPVYEEYFKGTFGEELAHNRSYRLWSISRNSVDMAEKYLARVIGKDKAKLLRDQTAEEYDKYLFEHKRIPFSNQVEEDLSEEDLKQKEDAKKAEEYIEKDAKRILVDLDPIYQEEYIHVFFENWEEKLAAVVNAIQETKRIKNDNKESNSLSSTSVNVTSLDQDDNFFKKLWGKISMSLTKDI